MQLISFVESLGYLCSELESSFSGIGLILNEKRKEEFCDWLVSRLDVNFL